MSTSNLLTLLRRRTREHHARLDAGIDFRARGITRQRYAAFLRGVLGVVMPLEPALASWLGPIAGPSRTERLHADLARLEASGAVSRVTLTLPRSLAEAYGCAYVLEGSALGGLVLAPIVEEALGAGVATSYLRLRGADTGRVWRTWLERLDAFGATSTPDDAHAACNAARATFDAYTASLVSTGAMEEPVECTP